MSGISDVTWISCEEASGSVMGCLLCFMGVLMAWASKVQPLCTLSSSESRHICISELVFHLGGWDVVVNELLTQVYLQFAGELVITLNKPQSIRLCSIRTRCICIY